MIFSCGVQMNAKPTIHIVIEGKPVPNQYVAIRYGKCCIPIRKTRVQKFIKTVGKAAMMAMIGKQPLEGAIEQRIVFYSRISKSWSNKKKREASEGLILPTSKNNCDLDNVLKTVGDGLSGIVYKDDGQVVISHAYKKYADKDYMEIEIVELRFDEKS